MDRFRRTPIEWLTKPFNPSGASRRETGSGRGVGNPVSFRVVNETNGIRFRRPVLRATLGLLGVGGTGCAASTGLLGRPLTQAVQTKEGAVTAMPPVEKSGFCRAYQCVITEPPEDLTGDAIWVVLPVAARSGEALAQRYKGVFFPELTVQYEKNVVVFADMAIDTRVRSPMPAATVNLLGNFTRLMLGAPVSAQKLSACYRSLVTEATCTVGRGTVRVGGVTRRYVAAFRTSDDGEGYSSVNYSIGLED